MQEKSEAFKCVICSDTGYRVENNACNRPCECRRRRLRERVIAAIPQKFKRAGLPTLDNLEPAAKLHPNPTVADFIRRKQTALIAFMRANPFHSFLLMGDNGVGKSHLGYALYLNAFERNRSVWAGTLAELLSEYKRFERNEATDDGKRFYPAVTADDLRRRGERWTLLLDEFDKPRVTEFTAEMIFELLNAAQNFGHQVIALSNKTERELVEVWGKQDAADGRSIVKRLSEHSAGEEIFHKDALR